MNRHFFAGLSIAMLALSLGACGKNNDNDFQGWIEADFIFVSPDEQGRVEELRVREGNRVEQGMLLFTVDSDLQKSDVAVAEATLTNAKQAFERAQQLAKTGSGTQKDFDLAQALFREADAKLGAARTRLARRQAFSPVSGSVQQVYFRPGETVPAGRPVMALLPPGNIKARFFVPEPVVARIAIDDPVRISCDGCPPDLTGKITFISRNAEFTPPVIYSLEERKKLVFLVEARPDRPDALRVGQPIDVVVTPRNGSK
jgi:HlyD family secretion protein